MSMTFTGPQSLPKPSSHSAPTPKPSNPLPGTPKRDNKHTIPKIKQKPNSGAPAPKDLSHAMKPEEKRLNRERDMAQKKLNTIKNRQKNLMAKKSIAEIIRAAAYKTAVPMQKNETPAQIFGREDLFPILTKMDIANIADRTKTVLISTQRSGRQLISLYEILIRQKDSITPNMVERINRMVDHLQEIIWSNKGILFHVWGEKYTQPEEEKEIPQVPTGI